ALLTAANATGHKAGSNSAVARTRAAHLNASRQRRNTAPSYAVIAACVVAIISLIVCISLGITAEFLDRQYTVGTLFRRAALIRWKGKTCFLLAVFAFVFAAANCGWAQSPTQAPLTLTLQDALTRARTNSVQFQAALTDQGLAHEDKVQA